MFIVLDAKDDQGVVIAKVWARDLGGSERVSHLEDHCFKVGGQSNGADISDERVTFTAHGTKTHFDRYTPEGFVQAITEGPRKLPTTVKTIDLMACNIGLFQSTPPQPSYLARVAELLAQKPGYEHIQVRGVTFNDLNNRYAAMRETTGHEQFSSSHTNYTLHTNEQVELQNRYHNDAKPYHNTIYRCEKELLTIREQLTALAPTPSQAHATAASSSSTLSATAIPSAQSASTFNDLESQEQKLMDQLHEAKTQVARLYAEYNNTITNNPHFAPKNLLDIKGNVRKYLDEPLCFVTPYHAMLQRTEITLRKLNKNLTSLETLKGSQDKATKELIESLKKNKEELRQQSNELRGRIKSYQIPQNSQLKTPAAASSSATAATPSPSSSATSSENKRSYAAVVASSSAANVVPSSVAAAASSFAATVAPLSATAAASSSATAATPSPSSSATSPSSSLPHGSLLDYLREKRLAITKAERIIMEAEKAIVKLNKQGLLKEQQGSSASVSVYSSAASQTLGRRSDAPSWRTTSPSSATASPSSAVASPSSTAVSPSSATASPSSAVASPSSTTVSPSSATSSSSSALITQPQTQRPRGGAPPASRDRNLESKQLSSPSADSSQSKIPSPPENPMASATKSPKIDTKNNKISEIKPSSK